MTKKGYTPLPVIVKYVKPGMFRDTCYRSFDTEDEAKEWIATTFKNGYGWSVPLKRWAIYRIQEVSP